MKKLLAWLLCLLLPAAALAETPAYAPAVRAQRLAIHAMYEKYGFTPETLGVFSVTAEEQNGAWRIVFLTDMLPPSRVGQYEAIVTGEDVQLTWSHDGTTADYAAGDPECAVWGPGQIAAYLAVDPGVREWWLAPYFPEGEDSSMTAPRKTIPNRALLNPRAERISSVWLALDLQYVPRQEVPSLSDELRAAANAAVQDIYAMTDGQFALFAPVTHDMAVAPDGSRYFYLVYPGADMCIQLLMNAETAEIVEIMLMSGGNG